MIRHLILQQTIKRWGSRENETFDKIGAAEDSMKIQKTRHLENWVVPKNLWKSGKNGTWKIREVYSNILEAGSILQVRGHLQVWGNIRDFLGIRQVRGHRRVRGHKQVCGKNRDFLAKSRPPASPPQHIWSFTNLACLPLVLQLRKEIGRGWVGDRFTRNHDQIHRKLGC